MQEVATHKTEVSGSSPEWPTKSTIHEEFSLRELLISILGSDGRRKLANRTKSNDEPFPEYYDLVNVTLSRSYVYEARRLLEKLSLKQPELGWMLPTCM